MRRYGLLWLALPLGAMTIGGCFGARRDATADKPQPQAASAMEITRPLAGSTSCAGRACHGRLERTKDPKEKYTLDEFTTWVTTDPHMNAYHVLEQSRSQEIAKHLRLEKPAHESERCLVCHTTPEAAVGDEAFVKQERTMGVGCESCHGKATVWLNQHIAEPWQKLTRDQKKDQGMINVADGADLAVQCIRCHVGSPPKDGVPARDVNHDLLAAGHPRLNFEFSSYFNNLPVHWQRKDFPHVQRWAVGQLVAAEAALDLLAYRAQAPEKDDDPRVWPEFSEYDCFGCHHNLTSSTQQNPNWRQDSRRPRMSKNRDSLNWGSWYFAVPRTLAELPILDELTHQMETRRPAAADVQAALKKAREQMHTLHEQVAGWEEASAAARIKSLIDAGPLERDWSWDAAEQTFLSLYALNLAAHDADLQTRLNRLLPVRAFPNGLNSPQSHPNRKEGFFPEGFFKSLRERR